jgi:hypothetical protein
MDYDAGAELKRMASFIGTKAHSTHERIRQAEHFSYAQRSFFATFLTNYSADASSSSQIDLENRLMHLHYRYTGS